MAASGMHFLQIPGPSNVPERILRAMAAPTIDHRGPTFRALTKRLMAALPPVFGTGGPVVIYPASGTGAWEAALVNTLSPGDAVLFAETGHFSTLWLDLAKRLGLKPQVLPGDWRRGADPAAIGAALKADKSHAIRAVCVVHNETSTGVTSRVAEVRRALDAIGHPALLLVDTISSLGSADYRHDEWGVDVTVAGSQKGLMLPPGLSFNAISAKALEAHRTAALPRAYWDWDGHLKANPDGMFPSTPATNLLYGLEEALKMLAEEGLENVFKRHKRHSAAARAAVAAWGLDTVCQDEREHSPALTAFFVPDGMDADAVRALILQRFDMSLGNGLGRLAGKVIRIGHLGAMSDLQLIGTLGGVEMGLQLSGLNLGGSGLAAAMGRLLPA